MNSSDLATKKKQYLQLRAEYYENGNTSATDAEFDALEDAIRSADPGWSGLKSTGHKVGSKSAKALLVSMPSLDKLKADNAKALDAWVKKAAAGTGTLHVSEKLDGSSLQAVYRNGKLVELSTRGDGETGKDISHFIPYVNLPKTISTKHKTLCVRLEAAMKRSLYLKSYAGQFDSDRALASAVFNRQDVHPAMRHIDLLVLKIQLPVMPIADSQAEAARLGFQVARGKVFPASKCTADALSGLLEKVRSTSAYILDGLVLHSTSEDLDEISPTDSRPSYAKAFKVNDEENALETEIVDIVWKVSSFGVIVPKAVIKPIQFGGVTVKHAALHNARWAMDRGAGIGARVKVLRSGDIIPKIVAVTKSSPLTLPGKSVVGNYGWDKTKTALVLVNARDSSSVQVQVIARFFSKLGLDQIAGGLAEKLVAAGYTETSQLPRLRKEDFEALPGVKSSAANMAAQMRRVMKGEFDILQMMAASGCFNRGTGETRLRTLWDALPSVFESRAISRADLLGVLESRVSDIPGCGPVFAKNFVAGLPAFWAWVRESGASFKNPEPAAKLKTGPLTGMSFCWTGYRSPEEEAWIAERGGRVEGFKSTTSVLFYREGGKASTKVEKAGDRAHQFEDFKKHYTK